VVGNEYAKAIYELAHENNKTKIFSECFMAVSETALNNKQFMEILTSPVINKNEKKEIIKNVYKSLDSDFISFLFVIIDHNRFNIFKDIYDEYENLILTDKNIVRAQIFSAVELTNAQMKEVIKALESRYNDKKIEAENIINPELIGGIRVLVNNESVDLSLKTSLNKLKESIL
jgi:F-type H+-transporting ATPase subunit delta